MSGIVDCDVHPYANGIEPVLKFMPGQWRNRFSDHDLRLSAFPPNRYTNTYFGRRPDAISPLGGLPGSDPAFVAEDLLDRYSVDVAVLLSLQAGSACAWPDGRDAGILTSAMNRYFIETWLPVDSRYRYAIAVTTHDPEAAAVEIRALGGQPGIVGVLLLVTNSQMGERALHPIYAAAVEAGLPVFVHPSGAEGLYSGSLPLAGDTPRSYPAWHALLPQIAQVHLTSLIFGGIFATFPELRVVFVEFGFSWLGPLLLRLDMEWRNFRAEVPWVKVSPSDYVAEHVRFTTQPLEDPADPLELHQTVRKLQGGKLLLFSSDYPHYDTDNPDTVVARLPSELRDAICRDNALELLGARVAAGG
jgi:uncharacterized protein